ncbi:MAG: flagellar hook protein [Sphingomonas sanxanigenens]|uniref:Flagellar hook-associated protein 2 n=1 Tax=Sphingomonas sanxanigenens TaxID=397260 RepID=A0A2W5AFI1_9SPHN|nr:MAG: flagellar hook protein [Sphingomonas sanxanigenens]
MTTTSSTTTTGSSSINSILGVGSGIDTGALVSQLISAQFDTKTQALSTQNDKLTAQISAISALKSGINTFSTSLNTLLAGGTLQTQPVSSNTGILTAKALPGASIGNLTSEVEVQQLASSQLVTSQQFASKTSTLGTGTLTFTFGAASWTGDTMSGFAADSARTPVTLDITSGNNTLAGIAQAINGANMGVTATVVTSTTGATLSIKGPSGEAQAFRIDATETSTGDAGLSSLAYNPDSASLSLSRKAQDAILVVDGVSAHRATNSITDLIPGMQLDLAKAEVGTKVTLNPSRPTDAISQAVNDFVGAYNELKSLLAADTDPKTGALNNDPAVRAMSQQLATLTSTQLLATAPAGAPKTLAEIGVRTNRDGTLSLDSDKLTAALANYPDAVEQMFNPQQTVDSPFLTVTSKQGATAAGVYQISNVVARQPGQSASGTIAGMAGLPVGDILSASRASAAAGLSLKVTGDVASATVSIDLGIGQMMANLADSITDPDTGLGASNDRYTRQQSDLADQQDKLSTDSAAMRDRLTQQFATMDSRVAAYKATQSFLEQQIKVWTNSNN